ncbi:hypothetical protein SAMN05660649_04797 [Desulfotomaculum arcticum]|uniref:Uncharacterized protein n=1 Tax=Desulfotruncus arcticus DSM 17038 TaxID=1121424 RepID=A0A1I2Z786_9FIRM|nr:hypothetical protein [Desulfotruncus arcticus]SFH33778.1 hypothetical protein SAMN05660649_04797 [Desulfotomaculum arcticum] [Desulfotruncus arcticus DSM 17038]
MKNKIVTLICLGMVILLTTGGCDDEKKAIDTKDNDTLKPAKTIVENYLINAAENNWTEALKELSGEALIQAEVNKDRVKSKRQIIAKEFEGEFITVKTVELTCDFTETDGSTNTDRLAYKFYLEKSGNGWKIYKTEWGDYIHGELQLGRIPNGAEETICQYINLSINERRSQDYLYLAGKALNDSQRAKLLPNDNDVKTKTSEEFKSIECLGVTDKYAVARVVSNLTKEDKVYSVVSIVDFVKVNGSWKISRLDVASIKGV